MSGNKFWPSKNDEPKVEKKVSDIEVVEKNEPTVPVSQVEEMVQKMVAEQLAKSQPQIQAEAPAPKRQNRDFGISDAIEGLPELEYKDRYYTTKNDTKPVTFGIRNRHKKGSPLQWRNPVTKINHTLKFASNQTTFLAEFQTGEALIQSIIMRDGALFVPKENVLLQQFLAIHPDKDVTFREIDKEADAKKKVSQHELKAKAFASITDADSFKQKSVAMVALPSYNSNMSSFEIKESLYNYAENNPQKLINLFNDDSLEVKAVIKTAIMRHIVGVQGKKYLNSEGEVIFQADFSGTDELDQFALYLQSDSKGKDFYEYLKHTVL